MFSGADYGFMGTVIRFKQFLVLVTGMGSGNGSDVILTGMRMLGLGSLQGPGSS